MSRHIDPRSVNSYLSGIAHQLEDFYPLARVNRNSKLVHRTMQGCMKLYSEPTRRKSPLTTSDLERVISSFNRPNICHDDLLFVAMLLTGFFALLRLGKMCFPDDARIRDWRKVSRRRTVVVSDLSYKFILPFHKADRFFSGNEVLISPGTWSPDPLPHFKSYLASRDALFPLHSPLWVRETGDVPLRSFFTRRLATFFGREICGQSMRAGGATFLAEHRVPPSLIQARGRWSSDAFLIYIRKNPALLINLITA
jgi:hypothetical protein